MVNYSDFPFSKIQKISSVIFVVGAVLLAFLSQNHQSFAASYLIAFLYWTGVVLGSLPVLMIHNLTGGNWGYPIRRILESIARLTPWLLLLFLPVLFSVKYLYSWMDSHLMQHDAVLREKAFYLNVPFFAFRTIIYFFVWSLLAFIITQNFRIHEGLQSRRKQASGIGMVIFVMTVTFSVVDWAMSIEPHWNSTIYGFIFIIGDTLAGFAFSMLIAFLLKRTKAMSQIMTANRSHDLGTLLFVFVMLWAYVSLSQFIIIWSGNLPETVTWYAARFNGGWSWVARFLVIFHFFIPFFLLLMRPIKKNPRILIYVVLLLLGMRYVDLFWFIKPAFWKSIHFSAADPVAWVTLGAFLVSLLSKKLAKTNLVIENDPVLKSGSSVH